MASLQLTNVDEKLYNWLKQISKSNKLSMSQQVISVLQEYSKDNQNNISFNPVDEFLDNTPYFDSETSNDFENILKDNRKSVNRFKNNEIFT